MCQIVKNINWQLSLMAQTYRIGQQGIDAISPHPVVILSGSYEVQWIPLCVYDDGKGCCVHWHLKYWLIQYQLSKIAINL